MNRKITIYNILSNISNEILYVGSTINFGRRVYDHKKMCSDSLRPLYADIRDNIGWDNCTVSPILETEVRSNESDKVKLILEQYYIDALQPKHNVRRSIGKFTNSIDYDRFRNKHKTECEQCGGLYITRNKKQHARTKRHQNVNGYFER